MSPVPGRFVPLDLLQCSCFSLRFRRASRASKRRHRPRGILVTWRRYTTQRRQILLARAISEGGHPSLTWLPGQSSRRRICGARTCCVGGLWTSPDPRHGIPGGGPRFLLGMHHPPSCRACSAFDAPPPGHTNSVTRLTTRAIVNSLLFRTYPYDVRH